MRIVHHQRLPAEGQVSIERLFEEVRAKLPVDWQALEVTSPYLSSGLLPRLRNLSYARNQKADIHHIVGDVHYLAFGLPGERTVLTIHDCAALNRLSGLKREILSYFWFVGPMRRVAVVTTISESTKEELRRWVGPLAEKVVVVPNCVRSEFAPAPKEFADDQPVVLQLGTKWNKNLERVARALVDTPCRLEIVGRMSVAQRASLEDCGVPFRELGQVSDDDLLAAYRRSDLLMFTSLYEGFGLPILEAQATGRPVITSARSSMTEAAGDGALLVDPESTESIHEAVARLLESPSLRQQLVEKGFENVKRFEPEAVAAQYAEIYRQLGQS